MARPRKDAGEPSATERLHEAFWSLLAELPYDNMTVRALAQRAHVNKNAFYYHYDNLTELALEALERAIPADFTTTLLHQVTGRSDAFTRFMGDPATWQRLSRLRLVVGPHGSLALQRALKDMLCSQLCAQRGMDERSLSLSSHLAIEFAIGGMLSLWAYCNEHEPDITPDQLMATTFAEKALATMPTLMMSVLREDGATMPDGAALPDGATMPDGPCAPGRAPGV